MDTNKIIPKIQSDKILLMLGIDNEGDFLTVQVKGSWVYVMSGLSFLLDSNHYFHLKYASGKENRVEIYALWVLLKSVDERGLEHFQVFGDSKLMRDWANQ